jgi:hypothetical protein
VAVHIYTQTTHRTTQITTNLEECGPCPVFVSFTLAFALQLRKKHGKTSVRVREPQSGKTEDPFHLQEGNSLTKKCADRGTAANTRQPCKPAAMVIVWYISQPGRPQCQGKAIPALAKPRPWQQNCIDLRRITLNTAPTKNGGSGAGCAFRWHRGAMAGWIPPKDGTTRPWLKQYHIQHSLNTQIHSLQARWGFHGC